MTYLKTQNMIRVGFGDVLKMSTELHPRRCKHEFGVKVDPGVAEENGTGSVFAFYLLILDELGPFLGPLKRKNLEYYREVRPSAQIVPGLH